MSERSVHNFLSYLANGQTDRQTKTGKNITFLAEVKIKMLNPMITSVGSVQLSVGILLEICSVCQEIPTSCPAYCLTHNVLAFASAYEFGLC